jgi:putative ABC transport system permease protein
LNETDFENFFSSLSDLEYTRFKTTRFYIKIDRDRIIDPLSRDSTDFALLRLLTKINSVTFNHYNVHVEDLITRPLNRYYTWFEGYRLEMLAYSLPVIAVGFYLGMVGIELATTQKRRTLGIIKSRGASDKQVYTSLIVESSVLGVIAGSIGLVLGVLVSRIFLVIIPGAKNLSSNVDFLSVNITPWSVLWAILFAVFLMVMASIKPAKHISKSPIIESIHQHTDFGKEKEYKPGVDIFLVSFAVFAFIVVAEVSTRDLDPADLGQVFTMLLFVMYIGSVIWLPFSPFFLMFSLTRLLTRGTNKVYKFFSRAVKPFSKELWYIIHKNLARNPKKVSMVSIIIALALGFGVFMTTMIGTTVYGQELETRARVGGDLNVKSQNTNLSFETDLKEIVGVSEVVPVNWMYGYMITGDEFVSRKISLFNASRYEKHIEVDPNFFIEGNLNEALSSIATGNSVIVGESIAQIYSLEVGDIVRIEDPYFPSGFGYGSQEVNMKNDNFMVAAVVRALPGLEIPDSEEFYDWGGQVYMDFRAIITDISVVDFGWNFLLDIKVDSEIVEDQIMQNYSSKVSDIDNLQTELDDINNNPSSKSVLYLMLVNIGFMIIIITVGLALIMFISIGERRNEFATIMARGAEGKQMVVLILGEALSITFVGVVIGVFSGIFTAYTFNKMLTTNSIFGGSSGLLSGRPLLIPWYTILIIVIALLALIVTSLIAAYKVKRIKLHSALRIRGG